MKWRVPLADVNFGPEEEEAVRKVVHSGWLSMGAVTKAFEEDFKSFSGANPNKGDKINRPKKEKIISINLFKNECSLKRVLDLKTFTFLRRSPGEFCFRISVICLTPGYC